MILHIDMDAFFAAIEQRDDPALQKKPVVVSGNSQRSVVSTASYEARKFGIRSAMPLFQARQRCEHLLVVPGHMQKYRADSRKIMTILSGFSPLVEQVSIDEAYLDISGCGRLFGSPLEMAAAIKKQIRQELKLTCSIGIAPLKFLSKIASDMNKPDGITFIRPPEVETFIAGLPVRKVPGIGRQAVTQLDLMQIKTLGDVTSFDPALLIRKFGKMGSRLVALANGQDHSFVQTGQDRKSISSETTLAQDISDDGDVRKMLLDRAQIVGRELRQKKSICQTVFIKLKFSDFSQITRSRTLTSPVVSSTAIFKEALALYQKVRLKKKIRLVGVGVSSLKSKDAPFQMEWIPGPENHDRQWETVDTAVDSISEKFGTQIIQKGSLKDPA